MGLLGGAKGESHMEQGHRVQDTMLNGCTSPLIKTAFMKFGALSPPSFFVSLPDVCFMYGS